MTATGPGQVRIASVDIFRALTMLLMIFVNDLWSLHDIPQWLEHTQADYDGMGLADVVFPAFLFIVGLSVPFAIKGRISRGETAGKISLHILSRSLALITMGFFHVNLGNMQPGLMPLSRQVYEIIMTVAFFLIWNIYPGNGGVLGISSRWLRIMGIAALIMLASLYKGGSMENPVWMRPYWWGILGLIGWAYLVSAFIYLFFRNILWLLALFLLLFCLLNVWEFSSLFGILPKFRLIISASNYSLVLCGIFASAIFQKFTSREKWEWKYAGILILLAVVCILFGFWVRPLGGISKIKATPSWTAICAGISFAVYGILFIMADKYRITRWAGIIAPAGRSTLTCYLIPYVVYPVMTLVGWKWPEALTSGIPGLIKTLVFAWIIVWITGLLEKIHVKLKI